MKKHITICALVGGLMIGAVSINSAGDKIGKTFPMEFGTQYREQAVNKGDAVINFRGATMMASYFDVDGDGLYEISELRRIYGREQGTDNYMVEEQPLFYSFDGDGDNVYNAHEILVDIAEDGLNGNEIILKDYEKNFFEGKKILI